MNLSDAGGRKFILGLLIVTCGVGIVALGKLSATEWVELCKWTMGIFVAGNVAQAIGEKK